MGGDSESDSDSSLIGTHISDDEEGPVRSRAEQRMRQNDPNRQAKFKHLHEQAVHDEQGRQRFHGAFTGGFSAGYYNTAGSEAGWAPSEWKSSREARNQDRPAQKPEDFMDDEDLAAHRGSQALVAQAGFSRASSSSAQPAVESEAHERLGEELAGLLVVPTRHAESMGFRILRAMGWREGFGVGERVRGRKPRRKPHATGGAQGGAGGPKVYGCARGPPPSTEAQGDGDDDDDDDEGGEGADHDREMVRVWAMHPRHRRPCWQPLSTISTAWAISRTPASVSSQ